nr:MAG TPA: hypothetical protein [Caudoviricetes sp.]
MPRAKRQKGKDKRQLAFPEFRVVSLSERPKLPLSH